MAAAAPSVKKRILVALVALPLALIFLEGLLSLVWFFVDYRTFQGELETASEAPIDFHCAYDPELGWKHIPGKQVPDLYGAGRGITINRDGFRGVEDYVGRKPADRYRVVCLGDSFTLGVGVGDADTYPAFLQRMNPAIQVVNMGQGGYSLGQCFLWYRRRAAELEADCLVFAYINDDIWRMSGTRSNTGHGIPVFELVDKQLVVSNIPVPERVPAGDAIAHRGQVRRFLSEHSGFFRTLGALGGRTPEEPKERDADEHLAVAMAIFREVHRLAQERGIPLVLVQLPERRQVFVPNLRANYLAIAERFRQFARRQGIHFLDLLGKFVEAGPGADRFYLKDDVWQHYSPQGNRFVAQHIEAFLRAEVAAFPGE